MDIHIQQLIEISHFFGKNVDYVIGGGGNTSYKNNEFIWIKGTGKSLATLEETGLCCLDRNLLRQIAVKSYSPFFLERDKQVKRDLYHSMLNPQTDPLPSIESSMHELLSYRFVVHTHPVFVNALMCSKNGKIKANELFAEDAIYVEYFHPGYSLFKAVEKEIQDFRKRKNREPKLIFLGNHGIIVGSNSIEEIKKLYAEVERKIYAEIKNPPKEIPLEIDSQVINILPALRVAMYAGEVKCAAIRNNSIISEYIWKEETFEKVRRAFTYDSTIYCHSHFAYINLPPEELNVKNILVKISEFEKEHGFKPKILAIHGLGVISVDDTPQSVDINLDLFCYLLRICSMSEYFGGVNNLSNDLLKEIEAYSKESYTGIQNKKNQTKGKVENKIAIVTGAAKGFGEGIAVQLYNEGANVVIADLDEVCGNALVEDMNSQNKKNKAFFVKVNVMSPDSVQGMVQKTVEKFGGLDIMVSNAGVLKAGSLEEMTLEDFDFVTKVNYHGYFLCTKYASVVMKVQHLNNKNIFMDIIQINSKSGLKGSNKNFAYAGGKFGGIGLTQSFAMELVGYNIKVNSICPGNFFEGPLWSDPNNGLFVQYLNAGKVPNAKNIEDVKKFYEAQVPMKRGCRPEDVMKAIFYVIEQNYETGQAIPVTGGQNMLK